jgi:hypothetical protein
LDRNFNLTSGGSFLLAKARHSQPRAICSCLFASQRKAIKA